MRWPEWIAYSKKSPLLRNISFCKIYCRPHTSYLILNFVLIRISAEYHFLFSGDLIVCIVFVEDRKKQKGGTSAEYVQSRMD